MRETLGRLEGLDLREIWASEPHDFTPWLLENADALGEILGIDLELSGAEYAVGDFALDLIGRDLTNNCVIVVENQLTSTDHVHLGQTITYAAGTDARTIVWIAREFREEHRQALDFLNELGGEDVRFFGVEISAVRIADSPAAPLFRLRAQPNDWHAQVAANARSASRQSGRAALYQAFWAKFLDRVKVERPGWTHARKPQPLNWFSMSSPLKGATSFAACFGQGGKLRSELYIDDEDPEKAAALYRSLFAAKEIIDGAYGKALSWEELPDKRASRIADYTDGDISDEGSMGAQIDWFIETGSRLREAIDTARATDKTPRSRI
jgi:hypothetical protein